jgi:hypothetical protein
LIANNLNELIVCAFSDRPIAVPSHSCFGLCLSLADTRQTKCRHTANNACTYFCVSLSVYLLYRGITNRAFVLYQRDYMLRCAFHKFGGKPTRLALNLKPESLLIKRWTWRRNIYTHKNELVCMFTRENQWHSR